MEALSEATVAFTLALALSLVIERVLEALKAGYDLADSHFDLWKFWTKRARRTRDLLERKLHAFVYVDAGAAARVLDKFSEMLLDAKAGYTDTVPMLSGDLVRAVWVRLGAKVVGIAMGIGLAFLVRLDLLSWAHSDAPVASPWGMTATGVALGLGSGAVHKVITTIDRKRKQRAEVANG